MSHDLIIEHRIGCAIV